MGKFLACLLRSVNEWDNGLFGEHNSDLIASSRKLETMNRAWLQAETRRWRSRTWRGTQPKTRQKDI